MYNITSEAFGSCFECQVPSLTGVCRSCQPRLPFGASWCVCERSGAIKKLLHDYKFSRLYGAHQPLAELLDDYLPILPPKAIVVPIPTISRHVRQRGYDQTSLIAKKFAVRRHLKHQPLLKRKTNTVQVGASQKLRQLQARQAFRVSGSVEPKTTYVIIDDIITTGATMRAAAECLRQAGASQIVIAAIAR